MVFELRGTDGQINAGTTVAHNEKFVVPEAFVLNEKNARF